MQTAHLNTATVILQKEFDCSLLTKTNDRPKCLMFNAGVSIKNEEFPQLILSEDRKGRIHFEPLNSSNKNMINILIFLFERMGGMKDLTNYRLLLRATYTLMKNNDPILETIKGKYVIVPIVSGDSDTLSLSSIVFDPVYQHEPVWGVSVKKHYEINSHNSVIPILL